MSAIEVSTGTEVQCCVWICNLSLLFQHVSVTMGSFIFQQQYPPFPPHKRRVTWIELNSAILSWGCNRRPFWIRTNSSSGIFSIFYQNIQNHDPIQKWLGEHSFRSHHPQSRLLFHWIGKRTEPWLSFLSFTENMSNFWNLSLSACMECTRHGLYTRFLYGPKQFVESSFVVHSSARHTFKWGR